MVGSRRSTPPTQQRLTWQERDARACPPGVRLPEQEPRVRSGFTHAALTVPRWTWQTRSDSAWTAGRSPGGYGATAWLSERGCRRRGRVPLTAVNRRRGCQGHGVGSPKSCKTKKDGYIRSRRRREFAAHPDQTLGRKALGSKSRPSSSAASARSKSKRRCASSAFPLLDPEADEEDPDCQHRAKHAEDADARCHQVGASESVHE
jgi:hypothetical protein